MFTTSLLPTVFLLTLVPFSITPKDPSVVSVSFGKDSGSSDEVDYGKKGLAFATGFDHLPVGSTSRSVFGIVFAFAHQAQGHHPAGKSSETDTDTDYDQTDETGNTKWGSTGPQAWKRIDLGPSIVDHSVDHSIHSDLGCEVDEKKKRSLLKGGGGGGGGKSAGSKGKNGGGSGTKAASGSGPGTGSDGNGNAKWGNQMQAWRKRSPSDRSTHIDHLLANRAPDTQPEAKADPFVLSPLMGGLVPGEGKEGQDTPSAQSGRVSNGNEPSSGHASSSGSDSDTTDDDTPSTDASSPKSSDSDSSSDEDTGNAKWGGNGPKAWKKRGGGKVKSGGNGGGGGKGKGMSDGKSGTEGGDSTGGQKWGNQMQAWKRSTEEAYQDLVNDVRSNDKRSDIRTGQPVDIHQDLGLLHPGRPFAIDL